MTEIQFDERRINPLEVGPEGLKDCPGRNDPRYGAWMISHLIPTGVRKCAPVIADPMCGGGQLWMLRPVGAQVEGCEMVAERVEIARANGILAQHGRAEDWTPTRLPVDLIAFSPPYPNCDHDSGKTAHQKQIVASKGLQSMQAIEPVACLWRVFAQIATWRGTAPVAVIVKNYIDGQAEVDWASEVAASMAMAGLGAVERYYRRVPPGPTEQWKVARGEYSARTGKTHRVVDREWVLVARGGAE